MASHEALFRNSLWSHGNGDISLRSFDDLEPRHNAEGERRRRALEPVSKFSSDTDDDDSDYVDYYSSPHISSLHSDSSRRSERRARNREPAAPLAISRVYTSEQQPREYVAPRILSNAEQQEELPRRLQLNTPAQRNLARPEEPDMSSLWETLLVTTICIAHLCAQAGIGQTLPIMKSVGSHFRIANDSDLSVSIAGYAVALGTCILITSRLGETFGHKRIFIVGLVWSAISPLMVGASFYSTRSLFISSRAVQGLGAALTLPTGLQLLRARRPTGLRKVIVFTLYATMLPVGLIVGAVGASILAKLTWWSWVYWAYSITLVALGTVSCFAIPSIPQARSLPPGARAAMLELDIPGMITGVTALGLFGFTWCQAHVVGWQQVYLWIVLVMSVVLAALFVIIEVSYAPKPLIPCSALPSDVFWILIAIGCSWSCFGIWLVYGWQFVERFRSTSPLLTTAYFAPVAIMGCFTIATTPFILDRSRLHVLFCAAMLATMIGGVLISTMPTRQTYWQQLFMSILFMSWGVYTSVPVATLLISKAVQTRHGGIVAPLVWMVTYYSMGLGLGVAGTVESRIMSGRLTAHHRLRGYRAAYWMSFALAGVGFMVCVALALISGARRQRSCCERHDCGSRHRSVAGDD